jgi:hypothetical protein
MLLPSLVIKKKESCFFATEPFLAIFRTGQAFFKSLEEVISSGEVSEGSTALKST